jgi:hypothetical protein
LLGGLTFVVHCANPLCSPTVAASC